MNIKLKRRIPMKKHYFLTSRMGTGIGSAKHILQQKRDAVRSNLCIYLGRKNPITPWKLRNCGPKWSSRGTFWLVCYCCRWSKLSTLGSNCLVVVFFPADGTCGLKVFGLKHSRWQHLPRILVGRRIKAKRPINCW